MTTQLVLTRDGSHTLHNEALNVYYHSINGALQESVHIFINLGLKEIIRQRRETKSEAPIFLFEMGFGTGLNALLTWLEAEKNCIPVHYVTIEAFPIAPEQALLLNYDGLLNTQQLSQLHHSPWGKTTELSPYFWLEKHKATLQKFETSHSFDAIYYDAFAPTAQPELWTEGIFQKLAGLLKVGGNLTTYCSKSYVQNNLKSAGLVIEKHPGPKYKREVIRAVK